MRQFALEDFVEGLLGKLEIELEDDRLSAHSRDISLCLMLEVQKKKKT